MSRRRRVREAAQHGTFAALLIAFLPAAAPAVLAQSTDTLIEVTTAAGAFAQGLYNSAIRDNVFIDINSVRSTVLEDSLQGTHGIVQINQDSGFGSNQANMVIISVAANATNPVAMASFHGHVEISGNNVTIANVTRSNVIQNILAGSAGIAQINQNSGNLNTNINAIAVAIGLGQGNAVLALGDGSLSVAKTNNQFTVNGPVQQSNVISGVANFTGIAQISQTNGEGNVVANTMTISVNVMNIQ